MFLMSKYFNTVKQGPGMQACQGYRPRDTQASSPRWIPFLSVQFFSFLFFFDSPSASTRLFSPRILQDHAGEEERGGRISVGVDNWWAPPCAAGASHLNAMALFNTCSIPNGTSRWLFYYLSGWQRTKISLVS
eukprot:gene10193-7141_t